MQIEDRKYKQPDIRQGVMKVIRDVPQQAPAYMPPMLQGGDMLGNALMEPAEVQVLAYVAKGIGGNLLEVGCHKGMTTWSLAQALPDQHIYALDWPTNDTLPEIQQHQIPHLSDVCKYAAHLDNVEVQTGNSHAINWRERFRGVRLVLVDGDHSRDGVARDAYQAFEYFRGTGGGVIAFHDYYTGKVPGWCGVNDVVDGLPFYKFRFHNLVFLWTGTEDTNPLWELFGPLYTVCHASNRPDGWLTAYYSYMEEIPNQAMVQYVLCCDAGREAEFNTDDCPENVHLVINTGRQCAVDAMNAAASAAKGDVLIVGADDIYAPVGWVRDLTAKTYDLSQQFVIQVSSGTPADARGLMVMSILSAAYHRRLGCVFYPEFEGMYGDDDFTEQAFYDGVVVDCRELVFRHVHPVYSTEAHWDETYQRQNDPARYAAGQRILETRRLRRQTPRQTPNPALKTIVIAMPGEEFPMLWVNYLLQLEFALARKYSLVNSFAVASSPYCVRQAILDGLRVSDTPTPDYILWIDDDNLLTAEQFAMLMQGLDENPDAGMVAGWCWIPQASYCPQPRLSCGKWKRDRDGQILPDFSGDTLPYEEILKAADGDYLLDVDWSGFPVMLMRGELADGEKLGKYPFSPAAVGPQLQWGVLGEDVSFCYRAQQAGYRVLVHPRVEVPHLKLGSANGGKPAADIAAAYDQKKRAAKTVVQAPAAAALPVGVSYSGI